MRLLELAAMAKVVLTRRLTVWPWRRPAPSPAKQLVILAHSIKYAPGRCIAGREISFAPDGSVTSGPWIRPVSTSRKGELQPIHYRLQSAGFAKMLDIVQVPLHSLQTDPAQPENWLINTKRRWTRTGSLPVEELSLFVETPASLWDEPDGLTDRVSVEYLAAHPPSQSLYLLQLRDCLVKPAETSRPGFRLHFEYNDTDYRLKITDPLAIGLFTGRMIGRRQFRLKDVIVCVSLGLPFEGFHYKLVASITQPLSARTLFTIGHSSRSPGEFIELLQEHEIDAVADVRSQPYSTRSPHFSRNALRASLQDAGIQYVFLGQELGARRDELDVYVDGKASYELIAESDEFHAGIERVVKGAKRYHVALMCAEKDPLTCHRTILVCRHLQEWGFNITHILDRGLTESQSAAERRLAAEEGINANQLGLTGEGFDTVPALDRAYAARERKIAFRLGEPSDEDFHNRLYTEIR